MLEDLPRGIVLIALILLLVVLIPVGIYLIQQPKIFTPKAQEAQNCPMFTSAYSFDFGHEQFILTPAAGNPISRIQVTQTNANYHLSINELETNRRIGPIQEPYTMVIPSDTSRIYIWIWDTRAQRTDNGGISLTGDPVADGILSANITDNCGTRQVVFDRNGMRVVANIPRQQTQQLPAESPTQLVQPPQNPVVNQPQLPASQTPVIVPVPQQGQTDVETPTQNTQRVNEAVRSTPKQPVLRTVICLVGQISKVINNRLVCVNRNTN